MASSGLAALALAAGGVVATAAPAVAEDGPAAHFVVLGPTGNLAATEDSIRQADGDILISYEQIGVVVVSATSADFAENVRGMDGVQGAGATRALAELLPEAQAQSTAAAGWDAGGENLAGGFSAAEASQATAGEGEEEPLAANQWNNRLIKADQAHEITLGSSDVLVGVLDTGVDATHPDLAPNIDAANSVGCSDEGVPNTSPSAWAPGSWDHGTHVAGTIAAAKNGIGIAGIAPDAKLASVKVVDEDGYIYPEYAICGFVWAAEHGFDITNNSYFVDPWYLWCNDDPDQKASFDAVRRAIDYAAKKDVVNVASLGNSNWDLAHDIVDSNSPNNQESIERHTSNNCKKVLAEINGVVGVSSVGPTAEKSFYSNYGVGETDVTAPGGDSLKRPDTPDAIGGVLSTVFDGGYGYKQGTSMASPNVSGVLALMRSTHPDWSAAKVISSLRRHADRLACPEGPYDPTGDGRWLAHCEGGDGGGGFYGAGLIDALDA
ncbi:MAG: S8 family serine peptidase, partial [Actinophytocola sp.]|nr:S8 family serine peptidase [Actinophytocola sp.]